MIDLFILDVAITTVFVFSSVKSSFSVYSAMWLAGYFEVSYLSKVNSVSGVV